MASVTSPVRAAKKGSGKSDTAVLALTRNIGVMAHIDVSRGQVLIDQDTIIACFNLLLALSCQAVRLQLLLFRTTPHARMLA